MYVFGLNSHFLLPCTCFDHDAFRHHALHALDAPGGANSCLSIEDMQNASFAD